MTTGSDGELVHATCVLIDGMGVMLRGASGAGKSDLALRLIDRGATLIADDYVRAGVEDGHLHVSVPDRIAGLMEVRGVGILPMPYRPSARIALVIELVAAEDRLPEPDETVIAGVPLPIYRLTPLSASAPIKVELMVSRLKERL
ncbi:HPr kinase/phosphorylase [uncultured Sphingomonas sp.]|uniref:HPr kinase/phosphorylase n=1 Tax=uncultured Sphingomonas sp. TaxID=158754 RepID=UPI0025E0B47C|nr:HPr kinase/phosphatase C-terminal domain-containing protein [uncultured Sphingomonas sp.]